MRPFGGVTSGATTLSVEEAAADPFEDHRPTTPRQRRQQQYRQVEQEQDRYYEQQPSAFPLPYQQGGLPSSFNSPAPAGGHWPGVAVATTPGGVFPPGIQVPPFPSFHEDEAAAGRGGGQQQQHQQHDRPLSRSRNPFDSVTPSPSPPRTQHAPPAPPLTIVARVRAFLGPDRASSSGAEQQRGRRQQQQQQVQEAAAAAACAGGPAYVSVVARNRLVVVNPAAFGGGGQPDVVVGLAAAVNKLAAEEAGELTASVESQEWARAFELDRAMWSANPTDAHFVGQAALFNELGVQMMQDAFVRGKDVTCFAFGASRTGKTYTLWGTEEACCQDPTFSHPDLGLLPRLLAAALHQYTDAALGLSVLELSRPDAIAHPTSSLHGGTGGSAAVGALALRDLLHDPDGGAPPRAGPLRLREHPVDGPFVEHLTITDIPSLAKLHHVLRVARRRMREGGVGGARAHVLATVYIERDGPGGQTQFTRILLGDLAGWHKEPQCASSSPSPSKTGIRGGPAQQQPFRGAPARGNNACNNSLQQSVTALGGVLKRVARHEDVPASARASPLTWLAKATMRKGQSKSYLLLCLGPAAVEHQDTMHTLKFAASIRPRTGAGGGHEGDGAASVVSGFTMGGGGLPGTPVREEDVQDWSLLRYDFPALLRRLSLGDQAGRRLLRELVSDPQQRLARLQAAMQGKAAAAARGQEGEGDDDDGGLEEYLSPSHRLSPSRASPQPQPQQQHHGPSGLGGRDESKGDDHTHPYRPRVTSPLPLPTSARQAPRDLFRGASLSIPTPASVPVAVSSGDGVVGDLRARTTELELELQSLQVDRDVALSDARLAQEELRRVKEEEVSQLQRRVQDFERALAERQRECGELERRAAQTETEKTYLTRLLDEAKSAHRDEVTRLEGHMERLRDRERELVVLLSKAQNQQPQPPPSFASAQQPSPVLSAAARIQREELERQAFLLEQQKRQLAQELADASLRLEKGRLEAAEGARAQAALQEEVFSLRDIVRRLQTELDGRGAAGHAEAQATLAEVEALRARLRGKEAQLTEARREGGRMAEAMQARARSLERLALSLEGAPLKEGVRLEAAAIGREVLAYAARAAEVDNAALVANDAAAASSSPLGPGSPLRPGSMPQPQQPGPGAFFFQPAPSSSSPSAAVGVLPPGSPAQVGVLDPLRAGVGSAEGVNESLRQENEALKEKLKSAGAAQASTKTLLEVVLGLKKDKNYGNDDEEHEDAESLVREQRERRQRAAELAELKEYREVLREELKSLWVAMRRSPAPAAPVLNTVQGELDRARREALRLRRENDALVAELRDLDALILRAEEERIDVFAPSAKAPRASSVGRRKELGRPPRQHLEPALEELIVAECESRLAAPGPSSPTARKGSSRKPPPAPAPTTKSSSKAAAAAPSTPYSPYLQLLNERRKRAVAAHHRPCQSPVSSPSSVHSAPTPLTTTAAAQSPKAPVFPREAVRQDGKTLWVRESKGIEDWIGSLRASGSGGNGASSTPSSPRGGSHIPLPPSPPPAHHHQHHQQHHPHRGRGGVGGGLSPSPTPSPGGLRVPRR